MLTLERFPSQTVFLPRFLSGVLSMKCMWQQGKEWENKSFQRLCAASCQALCSIWLQKLSFFWKVFLREIPVSYGESTQAVLQLDHTQGKQSYSMLPVPVLLLSTSITYMWAKAGSFQPCSVAIRGVSYHLLEVPQLGFCWFLPTNCMESQVFA